MRTLYLNFFPDQPQLADAFAEALSGSSVSMARRCSPDLCSPSRDLCCDARMRFLFSRRCCSRTCSSGAIRRSAGVRGRGRAGHRGGAGEGRARDAAAAAAEGGKGRVVPGRCGAVGGGWPWPVPLTVTVPHMQCAHAPTAGSGLEGARPRARSGVRAAGLFRFFQKNHRVGRPRHVSPILHEIRETPLIRDATHVKSTR